MRKKPRSRGDGRWTPGQFASWGQDIVIESTALVFHAEHITIGDGVYVGHHVILEAYHLRGMRIGAGSWIGAGSMLHSAGGLVVEEDVGIGPGVRILTSHHLLGPVDGKPVDVDAPIMHAPLRFASVHIGRGSDIGVSSVILPGVRIGAGVQVGAGAVVTKDVADGEVVAGNPARVLGSRS